MSYTILTSNGSAITILGSALNTTDTSLRLIGRAYKGYGSALNTNFLHLLENFARPTAPTNPIPGQLWFNSSSNQLSVRNSLNNNWISLGGSSSAPIFSESVIAVTKPVIGFIHDSTIVGAFSNGAAIKANLPGTLSAVFTQGINKGLNIGNIDDGGVYGTSGLHFGLGNNPAVITVLTSITSIFGNLNILNNSGVANPTINVSAAGVTGNNTLRFNAGSSGQSSIEFNSTNNTGSIRHSHDLNSMVFNSNKFEFTALNNTDTVTIKNDENLFVKLETISGNTNKIVHNIDGVAVVSQGLDILGNYEIFNETVNENSIYINTLSNNIGIKTAFPSVDFDVNGIVKVNQLTVSANGTDYSLPLSAGTSGQVLVTNGNGGISRWESLNNSFIENINNDVGVYTDLSPGEIIFQNNNITSLTINNLGDLITPNNVTVSGLSIDNPNGQYSLPLSAGIAGQVLVSNGNGDRLVWTSVSGLAQSFVRNPSETVGFYTDLINDTAVIQTNNQDRLVVTVDGKFGLNTNSPNAIFSLIGSAGNYLEFSSTGNEASYNITTFDNAAFLVVDGSADTVRTSFKTLNANTSGRVRYTFFEGTNNTGNKEVIFYRGDGTFEADAKISVDGKNSYFQANGGNVGIGTSAPNSKLDVSGRATFRQVTVSSSSAFYSLPNTSGKPGQCITATTSSQLIWNTPFQNNEDGYELKNINEYKISLVELSATNWLNIPFDSNIYSRILININDILISANNTLSNLRMRVLSSSLTSFGSAYSSKGIYDITFMQTDDSEWVFENFFNVVSGSSVSNVQSFLNANILNNGINTPVVIDTHYTSFSSAGFRKAELTSGYIPASAITDNIQGIIITASNKVKILSGWITITGVLPKDTSALTIVPTINFIP